MTGLNLDRSFALTGLCLPCEINNTLLICDVFSDNYGRSSHSDLGLHGDKFACLSCSALASSTK